MIRRLYAVLALIWYVSMLYNASTKRCGVEHRDVYMAVAPILIAAVWLPLYWWVRHGATGSNRKSNF